MWLYQRYALSFRDIEDSYESIRRWCLKFGPRYQRTLKRREGRLGDEWFADEVFLSINGQQFYLWRALDQDGDVLDVLLQFRRDQTAAERFFRKVASGQGVEPMRITTDGSRSYKPAIRNVLPNTFHDTTKYANDQTENSHQHTRRQERQMQRFKAPRQAQRFLDLHARVNNLFRYGRHLMRAASQRMFRARAFFVWHTATCA